MDPMNHGNDHGNVPNGPEEHRYWREMIGAFVLGRLDEDKRAALRAHLDGCAECRAEVEELWPVAGALADAAPEQIDPEEFPPADLQERTLSLINQARNSELAQRRRQRRQRSALAAVAAVLLVAIGFFVLPQLFAPEVLLEPVAFSEVAPGVEAEADLIAHTWGTETRLVASGLEDGQTYRVMLRSEDGVRVPSGAFIGTGNEPMECNLNAALLREDATRLVVRAANGELVLSADLSENPQSAHRNLSLAGTFQRLDI